MASGYSPAQDMAALGLPARTHVHPSLGSQPEKLDGVGTIVVSWSVIA